MDNRTFVDLEGHIIKSSMVDEHQIVKITEKVPEIKNIGKIVCGDTYSNIITFEIRRYYDNVDLLTKNVKFIVKNELGMFTEDAVNMQYTNELLRFSWILSDSVTYKSGVVDAAIVFLGNESGYKYALKTVPFSIKIENSLDFMEYAIEYKNWFTDIECRLFELENKNNEIPNQQVINKLGESEGTLTFDGNKIGLKGDPGEDGKSAYEIAVDNGYSGTESEWLQSFKGEEGEPGQKGNKGDTGASAYEIAVKNGFSGDETSWLETLKGAKGDPGQNADINDITPENIGAAKADHNHGYMKTITLSATEPTTVAEGEIVMVYEE